ncbi:MAG: ABC transporter ATP-binding protein [Acidimicrobiia bacterium]|nr:ABC transporter ATP-binding protein [Acidimicrobiia bacterium]
MALLEVHDLHTSFSTDDGLVRAVEGVSFSVDHGRVLGIVGESGCGKSVSMLSIMRLLSMRQSSTSGRVIFDGVDLLEASTSDMQNLRGKEIAMIFQDPMTSLNPVYRIGWQLAEAALIHDAGLSKADAKKRAEVMLTAVGIPSPRERLASYPHELSGGMRQRVMIAMALINNPKLLIADEPTTALDVTTQAQILELIRTLRTDLGSAVVFITHDLGVVAELCDEVVVMYAGKVVERGSVRDVFYAPQHPYTWGLLGSLPGRNLRSKRLFSIAGSPPSLLDPPTGCRFAMRCIHVMDRCRDDEPALVSAPGDAHFVACHLAPEIRNDAANQFPGGTA